MEVTRRRFLEWSAGAASVTLAAARAKAAPPSPYRAKPALETARAVLQRQLGSAADRFDLREILLAEQGHPVFEIAVSGDRISVAGSSAAAICRGAYSYLRETQSGMITWSGSRVDLPAVLPNPGHHRVVCPYRYVQYFNPCTFGYTMPFWGWERWERELDWMALHGINMPLALDGQEAIWQRVWSSMGLSEEEIAHFSVGPAHQPWHWMGNINNFAGPNLQTFVDAKRVLQRKILDRMRDLGMHPVVPGFSGFVPAGFLRVQPQARASTLLWSPERYRGMPRGSCTFMLHPGESALYKEIGRKFIQEYKAEYGEVSFYLVDAFNELMPPVTPEHRSEELESFGRTLFEGIQAGDPDGTWVMQGWLFTHLPDVWTQETVAAFLRAVPNDGMIIMDYGNDFVPAAGETYGAHRWKQLNAFFGKQWLNGMAHAFGGNTNLRGNLELMANEPAEALHSPARGNLVGWAMCPEGTQQNEVVYELMTDMGWSAEAISLDDWIPGYCKARYGAAPPAMLQAWSLLRSTAYSRHVWTVHHAWQREPVPQPVSRGVDTSARFTQAASLFLSCAPQLAHSTLYCNDLIEVVAQAAGGRVDQALALAVQSADAHQPSDAHAGLLMAASWLASIDALFNTRPDRRLETWVAYARAYSTSPAEAAFLDANARLLITFWGWPELSDYASREWSGLIRDYYLPRWSQWLEARIAGKTFSTEIWEQTWLARPYTPTQAAPVPDLIAACTDLLHRCSNWSA